MKSYQFRDYGQPLEAIEAPTPEPAGSELLMRVWLVRYVIPGRFFVS